MAFEHFGEVINIAVTDGIRRDGNTCFHIEQQSSGYIHAIVEQVLLRRNACFSFEYRVKVASVKIQTCRNLLYVYVVHILRVNT